MFVSGRPQSVAVEACRDDVTVGKSEGRWAIPGLREAGVVLIELLPEGSHVGHVLPGLRDEHHHRVQEPSARHRQRFGGVIELRGVASRFLDDRNELAYLLPPHLAPQLGFSGTEPVDVALEGVDLAIVSQEAKWLSQEPAGERVSAVPLVKKRQGSLKVRVLEVLEEDGELGSYEKAFVGDGLVGKGRDVEIVHFGQRRLSLDLPAGEIKPPPEIDIGALASANQDLLDGGCGSGGHLPQSRLRPQGPGASRRGGDHDGRGHPRSSSEASPWQGRSPQGRRSFQPPSLHPWVSR